MSQPQDWCRAFATQARADLKTYGILCGLKDEPECQRLHFLQMACEKLVKAHLYDQSSPPKYVLTSHAVIAKHLPGIVRGWYMRENGGKRIPREMFGQVRHLAREIDRLAPAVDDNGQQPKNCEYPYQDFGGEVRCPATDSWPNLELAKPAGRLLLKVLSAAIGHMLRRPGRRA